MTAPATAINPGSPDFQRRRAEMLGLIGELDAIADHSGDERRLRAEQRMRDAGKMPVRERVAALLDREAPFLEISSLAGNQTTVPVGGGVLLGIGVVAGVECVIMGNDPTVLGGAATAIATRKIMRGIEISRQNRLPYIQLIESAGGDLRATKGDDVETELRENLTHFGEAGRVFYELPNLSAAGIPTIAVVFGSATAGGAYQPGLSDYTVLVRDRAKVFLAGPPLVRMATGEISGDEELGGAEMHASVSGLADYLADDEMDGIRACRDIVDHLNWTKRGPGPSRAVTAPALDPEELLGLISADLRSPVDVREVIGRVVDGSRFEEFKPAYGSTLVCGWAALHGFDVGILGNNGVLLNESAEKAAHFIQLCNRRDIPLLFLQNITGFMVGKQYERDGMVKHGSQLINALSTSTVPHVTILLGASYGAGNFGMSGRAFGTRFVFAWPTAKIAVMGPKQRAGVMSLVRRQQAERRGTDVDEAVEAARTEQVESVAERMSLAAYATGRVVDDGIIDPRDTRAVVGLCLSACHSNDVAGATSFGVFRL